MIRCIITALNKQKNRLGKLVRNNHDYEFLPAYLEIIEKPPSPWARRTAVVITSFLLIVLIWSILGRLDIHASAQGKFIISNYSKIIQALDKGEIISINARDGQFVRKGEVLIQLNPIGVEAESKRLSEQYIRYQLDRARLLALLSKDPKKNFIPPHDATNEQVDISRLHLESEYNDTYQLLKKLKAEEGVTRAELQANLNETHALSKLKNNIEIRLNARKALMASNAIAKVELLEKEKELLDVERNISNVKAQKNILEAKVNSIFEQQNTLLSQKQLEYYDELNQLNGHLSEITQELIKAKELQRIQALRSPVDGTVQQLSTHTIGGVVTPAESLMVIVPKNTPLEAEVNILNKDIGFVRVGQSVEIKIDSFPFTKYGTISGKLIHVSQDAVEDERLGYVFPARISLNSPKILIDDKWVNLGAGMSLTAEIKTGSRRVIDYLLSPLQEYQSEAMRER
ncbi:HlyD family type I secretion periplasmic adaptor subunit [Aeromonas hydrophila]|uniref:HlyD family type I secretion periplasmic adaptor subunit n=1 Tax=Aeromonas hydrophila TaxID=644 RepID=UPI000537F840|nr:HlyD family type I secretion periplasmic adaptor subunit [Aeromonas hydrophila]PNO61686.1 HlyD family type I secretion periplasmic adaptor subunit [Aeromonas hydrophila]